MICRKTKSNALTDRRSASVRSSPWPSSIAKEKAKAQIDALAEAGTPDCDRCIEHGLPVMFATSSLVSAVRNVDAPGAAAFSEIPDSLGLVCWLFRDQLLAKVNAELDEAADDKTALSQEQREQMGAQIITDMLAVERSECSLIWAVDAEGTVIDFRATTTPEAVLGIRLITVAPRVAAPGTSADHAYDIVGR